MPISTASAQVLPKNGGELMLGTIPVRLGTKKDVVLGALGKQYRLEDAGHVGDGMQLWIARASDAPKQVVGTVQFKQDMLVNASRKWGELEADNAMVSFFQKVYGAFASASFARNTGALNCAISRGPDSTITNLIFTFGGRGVNLYLDEARILGESSNTIEVDESVRLPDIP
jgi:hypothetical protein